MTYTGPDGDVDVGRVRDVFQDAFAAILRGEAESDGFNRLVLRARLDLAPDRGPARLLQVPAPDPADLQPGVHGAGAGQQPRTSPAGWWSCSRPASTRPSPRTPRPGRTSCGSCWPSRSTRWPTWTRTGSCAASSGWSRPPCGPTTSRPARTASPSRTCRFKLDPRPGAVAAQAAADVRGVRVLAPHRGRPPARRPGGQGRDPLVGPAGGLPHRDPRPDEGPDGQERRDRAGGGQGRLRGQAAADRGRPRGADGRGGGLLLDDDAGPARHHRQPGRRQGRPPGRRGPLRRRRPLPGGGGRQGHRHLLRPGQLDRPGVRLLAGRRLRLRRVGRLRPQEDGDHRPGRLGVGQAAVPRDRHRHPVDRLHRGRHRRHVRRRVRQRHAPQPPHQAGRGVQPPARVPRPRPRPGGRLRRAGAAVRPPPLVLVRLRHRQDLRGRRGLPPQRQVDPAVGAGPAGAGRRGARRSPPTSWSTPCSRPPSTCSGTAASAPM